MRFRSLLLVVAAAAFTCSAYAGVPAGSRAAGITPSAHDLGLMTLDRTIPHEFAFDLRDFAAPVAPWAAAAIVMPAPSVERLRIVPVAFRVHVAMRSPEGLGYTKRV